MSVFGLGDLAFMGAVGGVAGYDADAQAYITAVETADGQALETAVKDAIDAFVRGCKADGIWNAIKASCILAGARTLNGALVPLVGTAPTNFNFVAGDYNRKTGLVGDGNTKYLNSNRNNNADPQNNQSMAVWIAAFGAGTSDAIIGADSGTTLGASHITAQKPPTTASQNFVIRSRGDTNVFANIPLAHSTGLHGISRSSSASVSYRLSGASGSASLASNTSSTGQINVYARGMSSPNYATHRLAFYSIGESLNLALLDVRVTALINAFAAAIP